MTTRINVGQLTEGPERAAQSAQDGAFRPRCDDPGIDHQDPRSPAQTSTLEHAYGLVTHRRSDPHREASADARSATPEAAGSAPARPEPDPIRSETGRYRTVCVGTS